MRIVHIITGLNDGGAENMLYKLIKYSDREVIHHEIISLMDEGIYADRMTDLGIKIHCLKFNRENTSLINIIRAVIKARNICKASDLVDTWLYHADLFGFIMIME